MIVLKSYLFRSRLTTKDIQNNDGNGLIYSHRKKSIYEIIKLGFPEAHITPWLFPGNKKDFFIIRENRIVYIRWLMERVNIKNVNELRTRHLKENFGDPLLLLFDGSPRKVFESLLASNDRTKDSFVGHKPHRFWVMSYYFPFPFVYYYCDFFLWFYFKHYFSCSNNLVHVRIYSFNY